MTPEKIIALTCSYFDINEDRLKKSRRGIENLPRDIAIYLTRCYRRMTLVEIGRVFGIDNYSTVSSAIERVKKRKDQGAALQRDIDKLSRTIKQKPTADRPLAVQRFRVLTELDRPMLTETDKDARRVDQVGILQDDRWVPVQKINDQHI